MVVGQIGFHSTKAMKYRMAVKNREIINRIKKTKMEKETSVIAELRKRYHAKQREANEQAKKDRIQQEKDERAREEEERKQTEETNALKLSELDKQLAALEANGEDDDDLGDDYDDFM